jgi:hypothetical protein
MTSGLAELKDYNTALIYANYLNESKDEGESAGHNHHNSSLSENEKDRDDELDEIATSRHNGDSIADTSSYGSSIQARSADESDSGSSIHGISAHYSSSGSSMHGGSVNEKSSHDN